MVYQAKIHKQNAQNVFNLHQCTHTDISGNGLSHPFKGPREVSNGMTGVESVLVKRLFIFNCS